jgi:hypothetical protein
VCPVNARKRGRWAEKRGLYSTTHAHSGEGGLRELRENSPEMHPRYADPPPVELEVPVTFLSDLFYLID